MLTKPPPIQVHLDSCRAAVSQAGGVYFYLDRGIFPVFLVPSGFESLGYVFREDACYRPKVRDSDYTFTPRSFPVPSAKRYRRPKLSECFTL